MESVQAAPIGGMTRQRAHVAQIVNDFAEAADLRRVDRHPFHRRAAADQTGDLALALLRL